MLSVLKRKIGRLLYYDKKTTDVRAFVTRGSILASTRNRYQESSTGYEISESALRWSLSFCAEKLDRTLEHAQFWLAQWAVPNRKSDKVCWRGVALPNERLAYTSETWHGILYLLEALRNLLQAFFPASDPQWLALHTLELGAKFPDSSVSTVEKQFPLRVGVHEGCLLGSATGRQCTWSDFITETVHWVNRNWASFKIRCNFSAKKR